MIIPYEKITPTINESAFVAETAQVIGNVFLEDLSSVWFNSVLRGDMDKIIIGKRSNVQDSCILHSEIDGPVIIGENVTLGHGVIAHSCKIGSNTLIGIGSILLDSVEIGQNCIIGANSLVTERTKIPDNTVAWGSPAKPVKKTGDKELTLIKAGANAYVNLSKKHRNS